LHYIQIKNKGLFINDVIFFLVTGPTRTASFSDFVIALCNERRFLALPIENMTPFMNGPLVPLRIFYS